LSSEFPRDSGVSSTARSPRRLPSDISGTGIGGIAFWPLADSPDRDEASLTAKALPALLSVIAVIAGGLVAAASSSFGPLSTHMAIHIAVMNIAAPIIAIALFRWNLAPRSGSLWVAGAVQLLVLIAWHIPPLHQALAVSSVLASVTGSVLLLSSIVFWLALTAHAADAPWQAMLALLLTGKVACLMGGVLVFAPRALYATTHHAAAGALADQQLAGLLMLALCPLSYVVAGITIAAQMMMRLEREAVAFERETAAR
jgi:putative membrane protein